MTSKKKPGEGRKSIHYDPERHPDYIKALAMRGLTNEEIALKIGIHRSTLHEWSKRYPNISDALKEGKGPADAKVEQALYKRAMGYQYTEKKEIETPEGTRFEITEKEIPPDPTSCIFWLKNRRPQDWRDKHDIEQTGNIIIQVTKDESNL